ncbi:MAG: hypothetical protein ACK559_36790, partial [bacterium]
MQVPVPVAEIDPARIRDGGAPADGGEGARGLWESAQRRAAPAARPRGWAMPAPSRARCAR